MSKSDRLGTLLVGIAIGVFIGGLVSAFGLPTWIHLILTVGWLIAASGSFMWDATHD